jgi:hypothetical protein
MIDDTVNHRMTVKKEMILAEKNDHPLATLREIAKECDTSPSYVQEVLQQYGINTTSLADFKGHKADILAGLQSRILSKITDEVISKATLQQLSTSAAILHDKELDIRQPGRDSQPMVIINQIQIKSSDV